MAGTIKITLGDSMSSATSRALAFHIQVKDALIAIMTIARVTGWCERTLDIEGQQVTVELYSKAGKVFGRLVWKAYSQEEPIEINPRDEEGESLSQAALQVMDSYYEVMDMIPPECVVQARNG